MDQKKETVETYNAVLRHGGNKEHEINLSGVTMREIILLRALHTREGGDEPIPENTMKVVGKKDVEPKIELFEMARKYANTSDPFSAKKLIEKVFATALLGYDKWLAETVELEQMEREEASQRRQAEAAERARESALAAARKTVAEAGASA